MAVCVSGALAAGLALDSRHRVVSLHAMYWRYNRATAHLQLQAHDGDIVHDIRLQHSAEQSCTCLCHAAAGTAEEDSTMPAAIDDSNLIDQSGRGAADSTVRVQQHTRLGAAEQTNSCGRTVGQQSIVPAAATHATADELPTVAGTAQPGSHHGGKHAAGQAAQPPGSSSSRVEQAAGSSQFSTAAVAAAAEQAAAAAADASAAAYPNAAAVSASDTAGAAAARWSAVLSLLWHPSDSAVKPIVANRRIERLPDLTWDAKSLPFEPLSLQQMLNSDQGELEAFLTHIYRTIASSAPVKDKVNVLSYFESLCSDTNAANVLINSSLTVLFVRMLRNGKTPLLRIRLASVLGLLVRHATYIADELAGTQLVEILTEALRDKSERVRRRCAEHERSERAPCAVCGTGLCMSVSVVGMCSRWPPDAKRCSCSSS